jgi:hypothetical protein
MWKISRLEALAVAAGALVAVLLLGWIENERPRKGEAEDLTSPLTWRSVLQEVQK